MYLEGYSWTVNGPVLGQEIFARPFLSCESFTSSESFKGTSPADSDTNLGRVFCQLDPPWGQLLDPFCGFAICL